MEVTKSPNYFSDYVNILDCTNKFACLARSSGNYEEIRDIAITPSTAKKMGEPLTREAQVALRSELGKLMRIARISRHCALYDASISAQTSEAAGHVVLNPIYSDEVIDVNMAKTTENPKFARIEGYWGIFSG